MIAKLDKGVIDVDPRHTLRSIKSAIQGNVIKTLVELITNSHDSYTRLEESGKKISGQILITYSKKGNTGYFTVFDEAEGMSYEEVKSKLTIYGKATSGLKDGFSVRGYFGQGIKDALISMIGGEVHTVKDGKYTKCKLYNENEKPIYEITPTIPVSEEHRKELKISLNGTVVKFIADPLHNITVPHLSTVQAELANNYQLRTILMNENRKISVKSLDDAKPRILIYKTPPGKEVRSERFEVKFKDYPNFNVNLSIWRSEKELTQSGDTREGGILIADENENVLGISLFKFENEPLASHLFGKMQINSFSELLKKEEPVLKDERDTEGLEIRHPFCNDLITKTENILQEIIDEEKKRKQLESITRMDKESKERFKKALDILNEIAEEEAKDIDDLGEGKSEELEPPPGGLCLYPSNATVTVGKKYALRLRIDTKKFKAGSLIKISSSNKAIRLITDQITLHLEDHDQILERFINFEAVEPNKTSKVIAEIGKKSTYSEIITIPERDFLFTEGMVFDPQSITLHTNRPRKVRLYVYTKIIQGGSKIIIRSDNESITTSIDEIIVNEALAEKDIFTVDFEIWGNKIDENGVISAEYEKFFMALLDVKVISEKEEEKKGFKGIFRDYEFNFEKDPLQRVSYSRETGKIILYGEFPSLKHYIGEYGKYASLLTSQVLIADLVSETCFREIAKRKVEKSGVLINPLGKPDMINAETYNLSKKYGLRLHQILVNQDLLTSEQIQLDKKE